jgi:hypothetical protein
LSEIESGFWVLLKDIKRVRPNVETAAIDAKKLAQEIK